MKTELIRTLTQNFEAAAHKADDVEYWLARELQELLGYTQWRNFLQVIDKAKTACANARQETADHFADASKMVDIGSGTQREIDDIMLTRYACYLIAQNGDPRKDPIAFAMSYFAVQTRKQEILGSASMNGSECKQERNSPFRRRSFPVSSLSVGLTIKGSLAYGAKAIERCLAGSPQTI